MVGTKALNILHIEDNDIDAKILKKIISNASSQDYEYKITHATTLREATHLKSKSSEYDAILLDLSLPDGKGIKNIQTLKTIYPLTPIIVVSGEYDKSLSEQSLLNGAQEYISKEHNSAYIMNRVIQSSIFRKRKETDLTRRAYNDDLTGLPNKAFFEHAVRKMLTRAQRANKKEALIFIDLNLFKEINDTHGHDAGNQVLIETSKRLQKTLRSSDLIARYAGDEFVIYMDSGKEEVTEEICHFVANKIVKEVEKPITLDNCEIVTISLSIGIAIFPEAGKTYDILLNKADEAMYKAKNCSQKKYTIINSLDHQNNARNKSKKNIIKAANKNKPENIILIVDDCEKDRKNYKNIIHKHYDNYQVIESRNLKRTERILQKITPNCILLDNNLPDGSAIDFLKNKHTLKRMEKSAVIIVTEEEDYTIALNALKYGSKDYLSKNNLTPENLCNAINRAINALQLEKDLKQHQTNLLRSNAELTSFNNSIAHDLKSPIQKISMFCDIIAEQTQHINNGDIKECVERMSINSTRAEILINDLMTYSKINTTENQRQYICLNDIVEKSLIKMNGWLSENNSTVLTEKLPTIYGDIHQTEQLFFNLIANAVKFRSHNRKNIIKISAQIQNNIPVIKVEDNGIGIAHNYLEKIFLPFQRMHSADEIEGSGLGLSICKKIIQNHGGNINVESHLGKGSIFSFTLNENVHPYNVNTSQTLNA